MAQANLAVAIQEEESICRNNVNRKPPSQHFADYFDLCSCPSSSCFIHTAVSVTSPKLSGLNQSQSVTSSVMVLGLSLSFCAKLNICNVHCWALMAMTCFDPYITAMSTFIGRLTLPPLPNHHYPAFHARTHTRRYCSYPAFLSNTALCR